MPKRILIADKHAAIRNGIQHMLDGEFSPVEFGEAVSFAETFRKLSESVWDVLILDIDLPGKNRLDILRQLINDRSGTPVLVFSSCREDLIAGPALEAGAAGYLHKQDADTLIIAIRKIFSGRKYFSEQSSDEIKNSPSAAKSKARKLLLS